MAPLVPTHRWNQFDLVVVVGAVVDLIVTYLNTSLFRVFRVGRVIARIFRVLRVSRGIRLAKSIEGRARAGGCGPAPRLWSLLRTRF